MKHGYFGLKTGVDCIATKKSFAKWLSKWWYTNLIHLITSDYHTRMVAHMKWDTPKSLTHIRWSSFSHVFIAMNRGHLLVSDPLLTCWCTTCHLPKYPDPNSGCLGLSIIELMTFMTSLLLMWKEKLFAKLWWTGQINSCLTQSTMFRSEAIKVFCSSTMPKTILRRESCNPMPHCDVTFGGERIGGTTPPTGQWKSHHRWFSRQTSKF